MASCTGSCDEEMVAEEEVEREKMARESEAPRRLLGPLYARCVSLGAFVSTLAGAPLVRAGDELRVAGLAAAVLVCVPRGARCLPPRVSSLQQLSSQKELMSRLMQRLCSKDKRNVMVFGLRKPSHGTEQMWPMVTNSVTTPMMDSYPWQILMARMGDQIFEYLVEVCSLFMCVPPSCCYQLCGIPVYDLVVSGQHLSAPNSQRLEMARLGVEWRGGGGVGRGVQVNPEQLHLGTAVTPRNPNVSPPRKRRRRWKGHQIKDKHQMDDEPLPAAKIHRVDAAGDTFPNNEPCPTAEVGRGLQAKDPVSRQGVGPEMGGGPVWPGRAALPRARGRSKCGADAAEDTRWSGGRAHSNPAVVFCWRQVMFSRRLHEAFPRDHILNRLKVSRSAARTLMKVIFKLDKPPVAGEGKAQGQCVPNRSRASGASSRGETGIAAGKAAWRRSCKRLPKRFVQMQGFFLKLLKRYKKCRALDILQRHCPVHLPSRRQLQGKCWAVAHKGDATHSVPSSEPTAVPAAALPVAVVEERASGGLGDSAQPTATVEMQRGRPAVVPLCGVAPALENSATLPTVHGVGLPSVIYRGGVGATPGEAPCPPCTASSGSRVSARMPFAQHRRRHPGSAAKRGAAPCWCSQVQVLAVLRELLLRVLPRDVWGSTHNRRRMMRTVKRCLGMGQYDVLSLRELLLGMRVSDCTWLHLDGARPSPSEHRKREQLLAQFMSWLLNNFIMEAVRSFFYVTNTNFMKNHVLYFRKRMWAGLMRAASRNYVLQLQLQELTHKERQSILQGGTITPVSVLRFLPKQGSELRPIICMGSGRMGHPIKQKGENVRRAIKMVFAVLNHEVAVNPASFGSSVLGMDGIYQKWRHFAARQGTTPMRPLYFVKVDVKAAFTTIPQHKVLDVIFQILGRHGWNHQYVIRKYAVLWANNEGIVKKFFRQQVSSLTGFHPDMSAFVIEEQNRSSMHNAIVVEQSLDPTPEACMVFQTFQRLLFRNVIIIGKRYFWQHCGIPQGNPLSTLLCNLSYADMEKKMLSDVQQDGLLMRLTDDFLLVTPHLDKANHFLQVLLDGVPEYGCTVNPHKTVVNFVPEGIAEGSGCLQLPLHCLFPWCGLRFDTHTLEVHGDYSRSTASSR